MATETPAAPAPVAAPAAPAKTVTPPVPAAQTVVTKATPKQATNDPAKAKAALPKQDDLMANLKKVSAQVGSIGADGIVPPKPSETPAADAPKPAEPPAEAPVAQAKAEPAAPAKDRFSDIKPPDNATEVTLKGWDAFKTKANAEVTAAEQRLSEAQAQLDNYRKATPAQQEDVAKLKSDLQAAHDRLAVVDLSAHPDFQKQFIEPKKKAVSEATMLLTDNAKEVPDMQALLGLPRPEFAKRVSEMAAEMPAFDQGSFVNAMRTAYQVEGDSKGALSRASELRAGLEQKTAAQQREAFEATFSTFQTNLKPLSAPDGATADERAEVEDYNRAMASIRPSAEKYAFGSMDAKGVAELAARGAGLDFIVQKAVPRMQKEYAKSQQLIADLTAELSAIRAAKKPGTFTATEAPAADPGAPKSFSQIMSEAKAKSGQSRQ